MTESMQGQMGWTAEDLACWQDRLGRVVVAATFERGIEDTETAPSKCDERLAN